MSITEIKVDSIQNIKQLIIETQKDDTIGRYRSPALFRGLPNSTYTLQTSLYRNCKEKSVDQVLIPLMHKICRIRNEYSSKFL